MKLIVFSTILFYALFMKYKNVHLFYYRHNKLSTCPATAKEIINFYELTLVFSGELTYFVDNNKVIVGPSDIILIPSGSLRRREKGNEISDYISFNFLSDKQLDFKSVLYYGHLKKKIKHLLIVCDEMMGSDVSHPSEQQSLLLAMILNEIKEQESSLSLSQLSKNILSYLEKNINNKITLNELANHLNLSKIYLAQVFKKEIGKSIIQYFNNLKIDKAKNLILEGENNLTLISDKVGFVDYNYFSRAFKKITGYSPKQYQRNYVR